MIRPTVLACCALMLAACGSDRATGPTDATASPGAGTEVGATVPHQTLPLLPGTEPQATQPDLVVPDTHSPPLTTPEGTTPVNGSIDPGLQPYVDIAISDLAQRLDIDGGEITVTSAELKTWPDSSLGCPQPGMQYTQVTTDGALIVLSVAGKQYRYHAGGSRTPFLCGG